MTPERATATEAPRVAIIADSPAAGSLVREVLATTLPGVEANMLDPQSTTLALERTDCVLIDAAVGPETGLGVLRRIRAAGYSGAAVMIRESAGEAPELADAASLGARSVAREALVDSLGDTIADAMAAAGPEAGAERVREALRRTQRRIAAGEIALKMQHSLNNPLAALLAEAQLLALEPLGTEHQAAVERIIELCRRVIGIVRQLDGVGAKKGDDAER